MFPKRGAIALVTTALALVLLLSFKTPDTIGNASAILDKGAAVAGATVSPTAGATSGSTGSTGSTSTGSSSGSKATATPAPTTGTATGTQTITGNTVSMRYGDVAVQITVTNGQITDVQAVTLPARGQCYVGVRFAPTSAGAKVAKLVVVDDVSRAIAGGTGEDVTLKAGADACDVRLSESASLSVEVRTPTDLRSRVEVVKRRDAFERDAAHFVAEWHLETERLRDKITSARSKLNSIIVPQEAFEMTAALCVNLGTDGLRGELTMMRAARAVAVDLLGTLHAATGDLNRVKRIVKVMSLVNSTAEFTEQHLVTNGASELFAQVFGDKGAHARSAFGVAQIPMGSCVEIELIAEVN